MGPKRSLFRTRNGGQGTSKEEAAVDATASFEFRSEGVRSQLMRGMRVEDTRGHTRS